MSPFACVAIVDTACLISGTALVITNHPGWAWIPFVLAAFNSATSSTKPTASPTKLADKQTDK